MAAAQKPALNGVGRDCVVFSRKNEYTYTDFELKFLLFAISYMLKEILGYLELSYTPLLSHMY